MTEQTKQPNWLFRGLIGISIILHLLIFMYIGAKYKSQALMYIELSMRNISKPMSRSIPRPRMRAKVPKPVKVNKIEVSRQRVPPLSVNPVCKQLADTVMDGIGTPDIAGMGGLGSLGADSGEFISANDYFDMVRQKIETHKKYPDVAKTKNIEGRVTVRFVIILDGQVSSVNVVKSSGHPSLDRAAIDAVQSASPFSLPPKKHFSEPVALEITILFELT